MKKFGRDAPVECAVYAKENKLLNTNRWKKFRRITKRDKLLNRLVLQVKLRLFHSTPKYKFGYEVPKNYDDTMRLDTKAGNDKWAKATTKLEMDQICEYKVFIDKGKFSVSRIS